jgi:TolA-binding protein
MLGEIHLSRGNFGQAAACLQTAVSHARTKRGRTNANLKLVEAYLYQKEFELAKALIQEVLKDNPKLESAITALRRKRETVGASQ